MIHIKSDEQENNIMPLFSADDKLLSTLRDLFAQQSSSIEHLSKQITTLQEQQEKLRAEFQEKWLELPNIYLPRQEHNALGYEKRIVSLEEFRIGATKDLGDLKYTTHDQMQNALLSIQRDIAEVKTQSKTEIQDHRAALDTRQISILFALVMAGLSFVLSIVLHFMH